MSVSVGAECPDAPRDRVPLLPPRMVDLHRLALLLLPPLPTLLCCPVMCCRLNLFNPLRPEVSPPSLPLLSDSVQGAYELSLSRWEERQVAKCLLILAMSESGDNITRGSFRWQREMESMPGWTVTVPWLTGDS
jgi:hypothetical protein